MLQRDDDCRCDAYATGSCFCIDVQIKKYNGFRVCKHVQERSIFSYLQRTCFQRTWFTMDPCEESAIAMKNLNLNSFYIIEVHSRENLHGIAIVSSDEVAVIEEP